MTDRSEDVCVWLDNRLVRSDEYIDTQDHLRTSFKTFKQFSNSQQCLEFLRSITDGKVLFITSDTLGKKLLPTVHPMEQLGSIYLFSVKPSSDEQWIKDYPKVKAVVSDIKLLAARFQQDPLGMSFVSSTAMQSADLHRQDPSFMYYQLLKDILLNDCLLESDEGSKAEMLHYCRQVQADNPTSIVILDEFEKDFIPELAILWYTKESFLFEMLNKALRALELDVLYKLRYFLRHLYRQIVAQSTSDRSSVTVYRGQGLSKDQLEKLQANLGGLLSFNNFLSTSLKEDVAGNFLFGAELGVLFEMEINPSIQTIPFVNIEQIAYLKSDACEHELLFAMGSVFRIVRIDREKDFYRVRLTLSGEIDEQLAEYTKLTREKIRSPHSFLSLVKLMDELAEYTHLERFVQILEEDIQLNSNRIVASGAHHAFGLIYLHRGQHQQSLEHSHKSLQINLNHYPANHKSLTATYNNIGAVYLAQHDYAKALEYQQLALDCQVNSNNPDLASVITYTNNVGQIYGQQGQYDQAIIYHQRALELQKQHLGERDPALAETYQSLSAMYRRQGDSQQADFHQKEGLALKEVSLKLDPAAAANHSIELGYTCRSQKKYQEALDHFKHALDIQQQYFLPNHPSLATTNNQIARTYYKQNRFEESLPFYLKALEIEQASLSPNHPSIASSYHNISTAYVGLEQWSKAEEYSFKAVEISRKTLQTDVNVLASFVDHLGHIYHEQEKYEEAAVSYQEALELFRTHLSDDDPSLFVIFHRTARVYFHLGMYNEALTLYQKMLNIGMKVLPNYARELGTIYFDLSVTYGKLSQFDEALLAGEQAIEQLRKTLPNNHPEVGQYRVHLDMIKQMQIAGYA